MSVYTEVQTEIDDLALLCQAIEHVGVPYQVYTENDGVYRKWHSGNPQNIGGTVRGRDGAVVIHGGLDRTPRRYCGDTAFVWEDGKLRAKIDVAHGNARANWEAIQAEYTARKVEKLARQRGLHVERIVSESGRVHLRVHAPPGQSVQPALVTTRRRR